MNSKFSAIGLGQTAQLGTQSIALAFIASVEDTPTLSSYGDIDLAFAHLCVSHPDYCGYFVNAARARRTVILDNGIMELGHTVDHSLLIDVVRMIRPAFVTPPEVLNDGKATLSLTREFIARMPQLKLPEATNLLGVVHGRSWGEWLEQYRTFHDELNDVTRIGIPYDLPFEVPGVNAAAYSTNWERMLLSRIRIVELLDRAGLNQKRAHLLGIVDAIELVSQRRFPWIVSNDSSTAYVTSQLGLTYDPFTGIQARKHKVDMMSKLEEDKRALFLRNVEAIRCYAKRSEL